MGKLTLGLDIGVASVGWAIVDEDYSIIEAGSNIFPEADASKNVDRREYRQGRRLKRRKRTRINDFNKLWNKYELSTIEEAYVNILDYRIKGLTEKLSEQELYSVLEYMLKHRGISYLDDSIDDKATGEYTKGIMFNQKELESKLPCEIQKERLVKYGVYRGNNTINDGDEKVTLSNIFTTSAYLEEIKVILEKQSSFNNKLTKEFIEEYIKIFTRKREYYEGPGNEKSRTNYGKYTLNIDPNTGNYITEDNIFEKLIGKCSVYPNELRAAASSYSAQEFNALEDLNNLIVNGRKLEKEEKEQILTKYRNENTINVRKIIKSVIGEEIDTFSGYRIDKNDKELFHTFEAYRKLRKALDAEGIDINLFSREELDEIGRIMTINTEREGISQALDKSIVTCDEKTKEVLILFRKKNGSLFTKWHSFSLKLLNEIIPVLYEQSKNQMMILTDMGVFKSKTEMFIDCDEIPVNTILEEIYNPVVKRSVSITVKVINALLKKYGEISKIVIEMPRDKNSAEEKDKIKKSQGNNEKELASIIKKIKCEYGIDITDETFRNHKGLVLKLKLWNEQGGKCLYSGRDIPINDLIENQNLFEVDHIIPISISFDDSRNNKVLVYGVENQEKGNRTPLMYLSTVNRSWNIETYISYVKSLGLNKDKQYKNKLRNLLYEEDITKIDVIKGFISRNLNDTRYISKTILNLLQGYFNAKNNDTKVSVIRGSFTHQMRVNLDIKKVREESYSHHAVDAMLIAFSSMGYDAYQARQKQIVDFETGEILSNKDWMGQDDIYKQIIYQQKWQTIKLNILEAEKRIKYWYKVDKKCNRGLCNQTIYGTREINNKKYTVDFLNIYDNKDVERFRKLIVGGKDKNFLMYMHDRRSFDNLMIVFKEYESEANPFVAYNKATGDYVRKYSKNHDGPKIKKIKYIKETVGSCIDISHKYGFEKGSRRVILDTLVPYRMDVYKNRNDGLYYFVGVRHSDIKCEGKFYVINEESYKNILISEKMISGTQCRKDLESLGFDFCLSFYKNDIIEYEKDGELHKERFLSRTMPKNKNYIECKPYSAASYEKRKPAIGLSKTTLVRKYNKDILGNETVVEKEKFKRVIDTI